MQLHRITGPDGRELNTLSGPILPMQSVAVDFRCVNMPGFSVIIWPDALMHS